MRRRSEAPGGCMEFLVAKSVEAARARGDALLSLALAPLAQIGDAGAPVGPEVAVRGEGAKPGRASESDPAERARAFLTRHLASFYDFEGLLRWKRKFDPSFEDRYLVCSDLLSLMPVALALVRAQSPGGLRAYLGRRGGRGAAAGAS